MIGKLDPLAAFTVASSWIPYNNILAQLLLGPLQNLDMSNLKQIEITIYVDHLLARVEASSPWTTMSRQ